MFRKTSTRSSQTPVAHCSSSTRNCTYCFRTPIRSALRNWIAWKSSPARTSDKSWIASHGSRRTAAGKATCLIECSTTTKSARIRTRASERARRQALLDGALELGLLLRRRAVGAPDDKSLLVDQHHRGHILDAELVADRAVRPRAQQLAIVDAVLLAHVHHLVRLRVRRPVRFRL